MLFRSVYYLSHESTLYALGKPRSLRVTSDPEGSQSTSLFLTLPRPWSWLLVALFAAMSFVVSQTLFLVSVRLTPTTSSPVPTSTLTALGTSSTGALVLLALLAVLAAAVLGLGFRRAPPAVSVTGRAAGNQIGRAHV